ncbi:hypothetical protein [Nocardiopsis metallicus]|uniref:Uncharacterized protein n=1 Tax=Nocardiopsis metallicus TaxID=179819 RepID=A0A840VXK3_9ACTN|nr:hypothetical protein [Nocardiopsis metallicus]MBB5489160.1 hypothetical protein [Nocardiopsis metallicus]
MDAILEAEWGAFLAQQGLADEPEVAELVVEEPDRHDWRIVDAALDRLVCSECGGPLSRGPVGCGACDLANGFRYAAVETDRPGARPGNEHAVRVSVSVVRRPQGISEREVLARRLFLPELLSGDLPSTGQAQATKDRVNRMSVTEIEALFSLMLRNPGVGIP